MKSLTTKPKCKNVCMLYGKRMIKKLSGSTSRKGKPSHLRTNLRYSLTANKDFKILRFLFKYYSLHFKLLVLFPFCFVSKRMFLSSLIFWQSFSCNMFKTTRLNDILGYSTNPWFKTTNSKVDKIETEGVLNR